jgi:hypothetical protein
VRDKFVKPTLGLAVGDPSGPEGLLPLLDFCLGGVEHVHGVDDQSQAVGRWGGIRGSHGLHWDEKERAGEKKLSFGYQSRPV